MKRIPFLPVFGCGQDVPAGLLSETDLIGTADEVGATICAKLHIDFKEPAPGVYLVQRSRINTANGPSVRIYGFQSLAMLLNYAPNLILLGKEGNVAYLSILRPDDVTGRHATFHPLFEAEVPKFLGSLTEHRYREYTSELLVALLRAAN